jgi:hypothetical protein
VFVCVCVCVCVDVDMRKTERKESECACVCVGGRVGGECRRGWGGGWGCVYVHLALQQRLVRHLINACISVVVCVYV